MKEKMRDAIETTTTILKLALLAIGGIAAFLAWTMLCLSPFWAR